MLNVRYILDINKPDVLRYLKKEGIVEEELKIKEFRDFHDKRANKDIQSIRFNYHQSKQKRILHDFQVFTLKEAETNTAETQVCEKDSETPKINNRFSIEHKKLVKPKIGFNEIETKILSKNQSTPNIKSSQFFPIPFFVPSTSRVSKKLSIGFEARRLRHQETLKKIELEKEEKFQARQSRVLKTDRPKTKSEVFQNYQKKVEKIKNKNKEIQVSQEEFIKSSLKKYSDIENRVKTQVKNKMKECSDKAKLFQKNFLDKKKIIEDQKEQERQESYFNKIKKIEESRQKAKQRSLETTQKRLAKSQSEHRIVIKRMSVPQQPEVVSRNSPNDLTKLSDQFKKYLAKKELNRLIVNTKLAREKIKHNRDDLFKKHIEKLSKISEFQKKRKRSF